MFANVEEPSEMSLEHARQALRVRKQVPTPEFVRGMFNLLHRLKGQLVTDAENRANERGRIAEILRREAEREDHGPKYTDGLLLAAQLVEALTDDGIA